jgi:hypothetical protein
VLVLIGVALIVTAARHASDGLAMLPIAISALTIAGWIGFGLGRVVEERLVRHRDAYLFAEDVLPRGGAWRYRAAVLSVMAVVVASAAAIIEARAALFAVAGLAGGFLLAVAGGAPTVRLGGARPVATKRRRDCAGAVMVIATATLPFWWAAAPAWIVIVPVLVIAALTAPNDADAVRFEAIVGRSAGTTLGIFWPLFWWSGAVVLTATVAQGPAAGAIGAAAVIVVVWFGALRVLAWRWVGRRSGEMIVLAAVTGSAVIGAMAVVLAPIALAAATVWLWRRSRAATWLIA